MQGFGEGQLPFELVDAAPVLPVVVVTVLLAPPGIATRRLDMPVGPRADPHVGPGRGDGQGPDAREDLAIADRAVVEVAVAEPTTGPAALEAGTVVAGMPQWIGGGGGHGPNGGAHGFSDAMHAMTTRMSGRSQMVGFATPL